MWAQVCIPKEKAWYQKSHSNNYAALITVVGRWMQTSIFEKGKFLVYENYKREYAVLEVDFEIVRDVTVSLETLLELGQTLFA